jgi:hypothetical protein
MFRVFIVLGLLFSRAVCIAGVEDHLLYSESERYNLTTLDAVVEVSINNYFAYAEPRLLINYAKEHNRNVDVWRSGSPRRCQSSEFWISFPDLNALNILKENTYWVLDVNITSCLYGDCELGSALFVFKHTDAFSLQESPAKMFINKGDAGCNVIFGICGIDEKNFKLSFRNRLVYLKNNMEFLKSRGKKVREMHTIRGTKNIKNERPLKTRCYVVRDVGFSWVPSEIEKSLGITGANRLLLEVNKAKNNGSE